MKNNPIKAPTRIIIFKVQNPSLTNFENLFLKRHDKKINA